MCPARGDLRPLHEGAGAVPSHDPAQALEYNSVRSTSDTIASSHRIVHGTLHRLCPGASLLAADRSGRLGCTCRLCARPSQITSLLWSPTPPAGRGIRRTQRRGGIKPVPSAQLLCSASVSGLTRPPGSAPLPPLEAPASGSGAQREDWHCLSVSPPLSSVSFEEPAVGDCFLGRDGVWLAGTGFACDPILWFCHAAHDPSILLSTILILVPAVLPSNYFGCFRWRTEIARRGRWLSVLFAACSY